MTQYLTMIADWPLGTAQAFLWWALNTLCVACIIQFKDALEDYKIEKFVDYLTNSNQRVFIRYGGRRLKR